MKNNFELTIKIAGVAGQGLETIGMALCRTFKKAGCSIFANQDYMSRVRGGNNFFQFRISDKPIYALHKNSDIIIALDKQSALLHKITVNKDGIMILDREKLAFEESGALYFDVPLNRLALDAGGNEMFINTVSYGVISEMTGIAFNFLEEVLRDVFKNKDEEIIQKNIHAAKIGYDFAKNNFKDERFKIKTNKAAESLLMNGNDAIALGAVKAGLKFYSAYPMTPSTSIMNTVAHYADKYDIVVEQAEDEIAAINMIIGASFVGARSMAATSGGGFALMVEGLSLAGMTETPIVVVDAQRPAPATGFPTRTEQADLDFLIHAGHGEFARVVYAPGTIEEAFYLTIKAFNIAEKYQIPVLIMTDQHLADSYCNISPFDLNKIKVERFVISKEDSKKIKNYKRYQFTESCASPRAIPSWIDDVIYADSDEHNEEGHITEDAGIRVKMVEKRLYKKMEALSKEIEKPTAHNLDGARVVLIGFGSTYGVMKEASGAFADRKVGVIHLSQVWPFPALEMSRLLKGAKMILTVENNAGAQLAGLLKKNTNLTVNGSILRFDGRPFDLEYVTERIQKMCKE